jgi:RNA polymerase sigma-70 factor (ECF subfamily)
MERGMTVSLEEFAPRPPFLKGLSGGLEQGSEPSTSNPPEEEPPRSGVWRLDASSPDDVLAVAASSGNPRAARIIMRRYSARVRSKLHRWIGPQDIDDHIQEVFIRLFEQLPRLRDPGALRGFLAGITHRIACTALRRRRRCRMRLTATGELPEPTATVDDKGPPREAVWRFESILDRLAPSSRRVFVLRYVEKLELADVASQMNISVATAKRHLARAAATVSAMVKREPALAEYLPLHCPALEPRFMASAQH